MERRYDVNEMLDRAYGEGEQTSHEGAEQRYVYSGDPQFSTPGYAVRPNMRGRRRKRSTFNILVGLFSAAIAITVYISNIIAVNQVALEVHQLQVSYAKVLNNNAALKAEINRKSAWERIGKVATEELGLKYPKEQPLWFPIDRKQFKEFGAR